MKKVTLWSFFAVAALSSSHSTLAAAPTAPDPTAASYINVMIPMRDGVRLATDIYMPSGDVAKPASGRWPLLLTRTPYDKKQAALWYKPASSAAPNATARACV